MNSDIVKTVHVSATMLVLKMQKAKPDEAMGMLLGAIGNMVGNLSDEKWAEIMKEKGIPCGEPGCNCYLIAGKMLDTLDEFRDDCRKTIKEKQKT